MLNRDKLPAALGLAIASAASMHSAYSQTDNALVQEEVLVTGIRASLTKALDQKRDNSNLSEVVLAEDIGKFPDTNIAESLQRITGVAIERNGGEGQFITVRGFGPEFNNVLVNGRTMPTDNQGREFSFDVLASELVSGVALHKSPLAHMQEGAIGGTVDISTRRPLDMDSFTAVGSVKGVYDDLSGDTAPTFSGLISAKNADETLGALLVVTYSDRTSQRDELRIEGWIPGDINELVLSDVPGQDQINVVPGVYAPRNYFMARWTEQRTRASLNGTLQFQPNDDLLITVDTLYSDFDMEREGRVFQPFFPGDNFIDPVVDTNGTLTSFSRAGQATIASIDQGLIDASNNGTGPSVNTTGQQMDGGYDYNRRPTVTSQVGVNVDWQVNDTFNLNGDLSIGSAENTGGGKAIRLFQGISAFEQDPSFNFNAGDDMPSYTNTGALQDEALYRGHWGKIQGDDVTDDIVEAKLDGTWDLDGRLSRVRAGAVYTEREKDKRSYETPSETFICFHCGYNLPLNLGNTQGIYRPYEADGFLSGYSGTYPTAWMTFEPEDMLAYYASDAAVQWQVENGYQSQENANAYQLNGGHAPRFIPGNSANVVEEVLGAYVDATFAGQLGSSDWQATAGVRYVSTDVTAKGVGTEVTWVQSQTGDNTLIPNEVITPNQNFTSSYSNLLPSLVVNLDINDDMKLKFSAAKTLTRPTISSLYPARSFTHRENNPSISSGNPAVNPFESSNFDLAYEWYFSDASFVGATVFHKDVKEWITLVTQPVDIAQYSINQNPATEDACCVLTYQETLPQNQESATATGVEFAISHAWANGWGAQFNYTYVDSDAEYSSTTAADAKGFALEGLSPTSYNLVGFYEAENYSVRLAYNWREEFLVRLAADQGQPKQREDYGQWDMTATFDVNHNVSIFVEGINLLDEEIREFSVYRNRFLALQQNGTRFAVGVRATF